MIPAGIHGPSHVIIADDRIGRRLHGGSIAPVDEAVLVGYPDVLGLAEANMMKCSVRCERAKCRKSTTFNINIMVSNY